MKTVEKITLVLFSSIMLIISVILCLAIFGWINLDYVGEIINIAILKVILGIKKYTIANTINPQKIFNITVE